MPNFRVFSCCDDFVSFIIFMYSNTYFRTISNNKPLKIRVKKVHLYSYTEASRIAHARYTCLCSIEWRTMPLNWLIASSLRVQNCSCHFCALKSPWRNKHFLMTLLSSGLQIWTSISSILFKPLKFEAWIKATVLSQECGNYNALPTLQV